MSLGKTVARLRKEKNLTQQELADAAGTTAVAMIECGLRPNPRIPTLEKIARALGVSLSALFDEQPEEEDLAG